MDREEQRVVQEAVSEVVALCHWMDEGDVARVETVFMAHVGRVAGDVVDMGVMAAALSGLAQRAEAVGDRRRAWAFDQWYQWACASMRGGEEQGPDLPAELAALE
jgi:hypothetical protein